MELINRPKSRMIADPQERFRFLATPGVEVTNLVFAGDDVLWVTWKRRRTCPPFATLTR
jgi:hypothetical protein